jgi:hypothetical protein
MTKLTFKELEEIINSDLFEENELIPEVWMNQAVYENADEIDDNPELFTEFSKLGKYKMVEHHGGTDEGSDYYAVYHFIDHDVYIQFDGWYSSHHGSEYEEMFEVKPYEELVVKYKQIGE